MKQMKQIKDMKKFPKMISTKRYFYKKLSNFNPKNEPNEPMFGGGGDNCSQKKVYKIK